MMKGIIQRWRRATCSLAAALMNVVDTAIALTLAQFYGSGVAPYRVDFEPPTAIAGPNSAGLAAPTWPSGAS
jgi:hypothetical protein